MHHYSYNSRVAYKEWNSNIGNAVNLKIYDRGFIANITMASLQLGVLQSFAKNILCNVFETGSVFIALSDQFCSTHSLAHESADKRMFWYKSSNTKEQVALFIQYFKHLRCIRTCIAIYRFRLYSLFPKITFGHAVHKFIIQSLALMIMN
jgi:hypothetical protein